MSNRHYHHRKCSFNLPVKSYYTSGVKGDGKTIGLTNGQGLEFTIGRANDISYTHTRTGAGQTIPYQGQEALGVGKWTFGVISDVTKSGMIVEADTQLSMIIKY